MINIEKQQKENIESNGGIYRVQQTVERFFTMVWVLFRCTYERPKFEIRNIVGNEFNMRYYFVYRWYSPIAWVTFVTELIFTFTLYGTSGIADIFRNLNKPFEIFTIKGNVPSDNKIKIKFLIWLRAYVQD